MNPQLSMLARKRHQASLEQIPSVNYSLQMIEVRQTEVFSSWLRKLRDQNARACIQIRIRRLSLGNFGDVKPVGEGVSELRIDYGPGYRVYLQQQGNLLILLLAGGSKKTQQEDIAKAKKLAKEAQYGS
jgi:putative addiction module killer protein